MKILFLKSPVTFWLTLVYKRGSNNPVKCYVWRIK